MVEIPAHLVKDATTVVLVEGVSDVAALETLARRLGLDLAARHVCVIPMGGVTNVAKFAAALGPAGLGMQLAGLYDAGEERHVRRGLERAGLGLTGLGLAGLGLAGFFACVDDLEDEFIRALGAEQLERILDAQGDLRLFRVFQNQPEKRDTPIEQQLHRFLGTTAGRKERYGRILAESVDISHIPRPLADLLHFVA